MLLSHHAAGRRNALRCHRVLVLVWYAPRSRVVREERRPVPRQERRRRRTRIGRQNDDRRAVSPSIPGSLAPSDRRRGASHVLPWRPLTGDGLGFAGHRPSLPRLRRRAAIGCARPPFAVSRTIASRRHPLRPRRRLLAAARRDPRCRCSPPAPTDLVRTAATPPPAQAPEMDVSPAAADRFRRRTDGFTFARLLSDRNAPRSSPPTTNAFVPPRDRRTRPPKSVERRADVEQLTPSPRRTDAPLGHVDGQRDDAASPQCCPQLVEFGRCLRPRRCSRVRAQSRPAPPTRRRRSECFAPRLVLVTARVGGQPRLRHAGACAC